MPSYIQRRLLRCKMLVGKCPLRSASCRCRLRVCSKHFYNKKDSLGLSHKGRILGYRRLSRLLFFCAALFFCKEQFCVSLCTKKLLHFFFRFAVVRVECFLFCQQFGVGGGDIFLYNPVQCGILNATTRKLTN